MQNITDVGHLTDDADAGEDKIAKAARKEQKHPMALAEYYTRSFFEDMDKLNCVRPDISPRASGHIVEQIELVKTLIDKGFAYEVNGSVYFDVSKFPDYGKLSGRNTEEMMAGARVEVSAEKRNPADFALWKTGRAQPHHAVAQPLGHGLSRLAPRMLGHVHEVPGQDRSTSTAAGWRTSSPTTSARSPSRRPPTTCRSSATWVHNNMVTVDGQKMGKSLGNFITLKQAFAGTHEKLSRAYEPLAIRQLILNSHYRSPLDFSDAALFAAHSGHQKISEAVRALRKKIAAAPQGEIDLEILKQLEEARGKFEQAMNDDLNTAVALSVLFDLVRISNKAIESTRGHARDARSHQRRVRQARRRRPGRCRR